MIDGSEKRNRQLLLNFRIPMFMKSAVMYLWVYLYLTVFVSVLVISTSTSTVTFHYMII